MARLPACGSAQEPDRAALDRDGSRPGRRAAAPASAEAYRQLRSAGLRHRRPRLPASAVRRRAAGAVRVMSSGASAGPFLDVSRPRLLRRRAGPALDCLPARLPGQPALLRLLHRRPQGDIRVDEFKRRSATQAARGSRRAVIEIPHRENSNHNGGQLQFLGDHPLPGDRRRRVRRRSAQQCPGPRQPARKAAADRPPSLRRAPLLDPGRQPVRRSRRRPRRDLQLRPAQPLPLLLRHS